MAENPVSALKASIERQRMQREAAIKTSRAVSERLDKETEEATEKVTES
jgi:hypothetical protein